MNDFYDFNLVKQIKNSLKGDDIIMKSCEIDDKYKWDLTLILKNDEEFYSLIETLSNDIDSLSSYEGKLNCKQNIVEFFEKDKDYSLKLNRAGLYAMLKVNQDTTNSENLRQMDKVETRDCG